VGREAPVFGRVQEAKEYEVLGNRLVCPICGHTQFRMRRTLLNTRWLTLFDLDWANRRATNFICDRCGHILWFVPQR
jgi:hypothetical protein